MYTTGRADARTCPITTRFAARRLAAVGVGIVALVASSCGVADPDVAATYRDTEIPASTVDALVSDEAFAALLSFQAADDPAVLDGTTTRGVLDFLLQGEALTAAAEDLGLDVEPDEAVLAETIDGLQAQGYSYAIDDLSEEARSVLSRFVVADQAVASSQQASEPSEEDLRFVYESTADSGRWSQTCVDIVAAPGDDSADLQAALDADVEPLDIPDDVPTAQVALDSDQQCATGADLTQLPPELAEAIDTARIGEVVGPLELDQSGESINAVFVVRSRAEQAFDDVRDALTAEVAQSFLAVSIARDTEVNPRYGAGVELRLSQGQVDPNTGAASAPVLVAAVARPEAPEVTAAVGQ